MKKLTILLAAVLFTALSTMAQVAINKDGTDPDANSILHVKGDATNKNVLFDITGKVGIGSTNPFSMLTVKGLETDTSFAIIAGTDTTMVVTGYGDVGIGTTNPKRNSMGLPLGLTLTLLDDFYARVTLRATESMQIDFDDINGPADTKYGALCYSEQKWNFETCYDIGGYKYDNILVIDGNTGKVGIGTMSPNEKLEVNGSIRMNDGNQGAGKVMVSDANGTASWGNTANDGDWTVSGNDMYSAVSGNVGIGTTSPGAKLEVRQTTTTTGYTGLFYRNLPSASTNSPVMHIRQSSSGDDQNALDILQGGSGAGIYVDQSGTGYSAIFDGGNVGIGTTGPIEKLEVNGGIASISASSWNQDGLIIDFSGTSGRIFASDVLGGHSTQLRFFTSEDGSSDEHMVIDEFGQVGIGTTTPDKLLHLGSSGGLTGEIRFEASDGDEIDMGINTNDHLYITGGSVGIGATSTQWGAKLEVNDRINIMGTSTPELFIGEDGSHYLDIMYNDSYDRGQITTCTSTQPLILQQLGGNVGIGTTDPKELLDVNSDCIRVRTSQTPASSSADGYTGQIAWDTDYIYVCTNGDGPGGSADTWKRTAISTW